MAPLVVAGYQPYSWIWAELHIYSALAEIIREQRRSVFHLTRWHSFVPQSIHRFQDKHFGALTIFDWHVFMYDCAFEWHTRHHVQREKEVWFWLKSLFKLDLAFPVSVLRAYALAHLLLPVYVVTIVAPLLVAAWFCFCFHLAVAVVCIILATIWNLFFSMLGGRLALATLLAFEVAGRLVVAALPWFIWFLVFAPRDVPLRHMTAREAAQQSLLCAIALGMALRGGSAAVTVVARACSAAVAVAARARSARAAATLCRCRCIPATTGFGSTPAFLSRLPAICLGLPRIFRRRGKRLAAWDASRTATSWAALSAAAAAAPPAISAPALSSLPGVAMSLIVDSGCVWHVIRSEAPLINTRTCRDSMYGADGNDKPCTVIGDLPVVYLDPNGERRRIIVRDVRCVPDFACDMLSTGQMWDQSNMDVRFGRINAFILGGQNGSGELRIPFERSDDLLFRWRVRAVGRDYGKQADVPCLDAVAHGALAASSMQVSPIHGGRSNSHIGLLGADGAGLAMHARLYLGANIIRRLALCSADAPDILRHCPKLSCASCSEANAHRISLSHSHGHESPRKVRTVRPGQLLHADIAGPFTASIGGGFTYALVLVDDFTRYKWVYFMRHKSDAPGYVRGFIASFQSLLAKRQGADATWTVDAIHTDNAGEFLSREFTELLEQGGVAQTTCPPHVHELNGVAERAIRTIFSNVRSNMTASGAKAGYWTYLVRHSLDVLNRTTGPTADSDSEFKTSFELLLCEKPKVWLCVWL